MPDNNVHLQWHHKESVTLQKHSKCVRNLSSIHVPYIYGSLFMNELECVCVRAHACI